MSADIHSIDLAPSESEIAAGIKDRIRKHLEGACEVMTEAGRHGMRVSFNIGTDSFGRSIVQVLEVVKPL